MLARRGAAHTEVPLCVSACLIVDSVDACLTAWCGLGKAQIGAAERGGCVRHLNGSCVRHRVSVVVDYPNVMQNSIVMLTEGESGGLSPFWARSGAPAGKVVTWLILPVVICLSQRLSHACLSVNNSYETANGSLNQLSFI